jgi:hypothetical protein
MDDKLALRLSQAGMRFIAQMTIYNSGAFDRLRTFIAESYHPDLLAQQPDEEWLALLRALYETLGKVRVRQVIGMGKHHVIVLLETQHGEGYFLSEIKVEEDYPHRITAYSTSPLE